MNKEKQRQGKKEQRGREGNGCMDKLDVLVVDMVGDGVLKNMIYDPESRRRVRPDRTVNVQVTWPPDEDSMTVSKNLYRLPPKTYYIKCHIVVGDLVFSRVTRARVKEKGDGGKSRGGGRGRLVDEEVLINPPRWITDGREFAVET